MSQKHNLTEHQSHFDLELKLKILVVIRNKG